ncbi:hypothetical protein ACHMW9_25045 [Mesorhizobium terrae]
MQGGESADEGLDRFSGLRRWKAPDLVEQVGHVDADAAAFAVLARKIDLRGVVGIGLDVDKAAILAQALFYRRRQLLDRCITLLLRRRDRARNRERNRDQKPERDQ